MGTFCTVVADFPQHVLGLLTAAEEKQIHRPNARCVRRACRGRRGGESVGQVEVEQRHRVLRGLQAQLRIRRQIGFQREQCPAHGRLHIGVGILGEPLRQCAADLRQVHLARAGPAKLAVQRVGEPGHELTAGPLDGDQVHLLGALEIAAPHQIAQHVDGQWFALRQGVDDERHVRRELVQLPADHVADALRHRDVAVPHPHAGHHPHPARGHLVLDELVQKQCVPAGELPEPSRAAGVHGAAESGLDHGARGLDGQRLQVQAREQAVLPQGGDGVGRFRARPQGDHESRATAVGELMNDMRGQSVEQVRVVDADQDPALALVARQRN